MFSRPVHKRFQKKKKMMCRKIALIFGCSIGVASALQSSNLFFKWNMITPRGFGREDSDDLSDDPWDLASSESSYSDEAAPVAQKYSEAENALWTLRNWLGAPDSFRDFFRNTNRAVDDPQNDSSTNGGGASATDVQHAAAPSVSSSNEHVTSVNGRNNDEEVGKVGSERSDPR